MARAAPTEARFTLQLFAAFLAVALAFVGSSLCVNWLSFEIGSEAQEITSNALPSSTHLGAALDELRDLEAATDDYPDRSPGERVPARRHIDDLWANIDAELASYLRLPAYPGERDLYADVPASLRELQGAMVRLYDDAESGDRERARETADRLVRSRANRSAGLLRELVRFNTERAAESTRRIESTRRKALLVDSVLDGILVALTVAVACWMWRIFRSFSSLQRAHADLQKRRADELEVFGRRVAHDLLSPLASLTYCLSAFKAASHGDPKLQGALARARQCVQRAQVVVDNVFEFARSGGAPSKDARAHVREVVAQVIEEVCAVDEGERPEVEVATIPDCAVCCSRGVLASILGNLVRNALKYMRDSAVRRILVRVALVGSSVEFEVEDTGPGVPPGLEEAIFEPYVRGQGVTQAGLGLGLATVKRFCEAYGGRVGIRSTSSAGSIFFFTLPRAGELRVPEPAESEAVISTFGRRRSGDPRKVQKIGER
jgi:signal transduction histidine kinase